MDGAAVDLTAAWRGLLKGGTSTAIRQSIFSDCCTPGSPKHRALAYRSHRPCCSTPSAHFGRPTRRSQIAIEPAAPPYVSFPAISSFGGFRTPATSRRVRGADRHGPGRVDEDVAILIPHSPGCAA